jgi:hypothetical protein
MIRIIAQSLFALRPALPQFYFCAEAKKPAVDKGQSITASFTDRAVE